MRITESRIRHIIREEARRVLSESNFSEKGIEAAARAVLGDYAKENRIHRLEENLPVIMRYLARYDGEEFDVDPDEDYPNLEKRVLNIAWRLWTKLTGDTYNTLAPTDYLRAALQKLDELLKNHSTPKSKVDQMIDNLKKEGPRAWMRRSNDFHSMAKGGDKEMAREYYPNFSQDDFRRIATELDKHFDM